MFTNLHIEFLSFTKTTLSTWKKIRDCNFLKGFTKKTHILQYRAFTWCNTESNVLNVIKLQTGGKGCVDVAALEFVAI